MAIYCLRCGGKDRGRHGGVSMTGGQVEAGRRARQMDPKRLDTGSRQIHSVRCGKDLRRIVRGGWK